MRRRPGAFIVASALLVGAALAAADVHVYPAKGQTKEQQAKDRYECQNWAREQTGFDPNATAQGAPAQRPGGAVRGGARGAAVGAVGGAIGGNAGKGAAIGAATGAVFGGMRRNAQAREQQSQQAAMNAQVEGQVSAYNRALAACLTGRGYTVQ